MISPGPFGSITGITLVCGENLCGIDPKLELDKDGKVGNSPEMDRRTETHKRCHEGSGEIRVGDLARGSCTAAAAQGRHEGRRDLRQLRGA